MKSRKSLGAVTLSMVLSCCMFAGIPAMADSTETATEAGTEASTGVRSEVSKIAVLLPGTITDESWNQTAYEGLQAIADEGYETAYTENVDSSNMEAVFRSYAEDGYDFIIGHGAQYGDACVRVARDYPDINFFITGNAPEDVAAEDLPENIMFGDYRECEGAYVCGVVAGLMTKSNIVGYVGGGNNTTQQSDKNAFKDGVAKVNPDADVQTVITGTFDDTALGRETALAMIEGGADVILQTCDNTGLGALEACDDEDVYCLGYTTDQSDLLKHPELCLTSMIVDIPYMISSQIDLIKKGNYGGQSTPGLHDDVVKMAPYSSEVPEDVQKQVDDIIDQIKSGDLVIEPNYSED